MTVEFSVQTSEMSNFIHFFSNHASFLAFIENICSIEITPTPWLTRTCFAQISLARLFKKFTIPHVTRTYYEIHVKFKYNIRLLTFEI